MATGDFLTRLSPVIVATAAVAGLVLSVWSTLLHQHARRIRIVDLATKRLAFWDQFLTIALRATAKGSDEQKGSKAETYRAIQRVRSEADCDLQRLSWKATMRQNLLRQYPTFKQFSKFLLVPGKAPNPGARLNWYVYIILSWIYFLGALGYGGLLIYFRSIPAVHPDNIRILQDLIGFAAVFVLTYVAVDFRVNAEVLKYARPEFKFMDRI